MDMLRTCYTSNMRLYPDDPERLTLGRWAWCPDGAEYMPFPTAFCSSRFDPNGFDLGDNIGEVPEIVGYSSGKASPRFTGHHFCGAVELWQHGSPLDLEGTPAVDPEGVPLCCDGPPAIGGAALGGEGTATSWDDVALWLRNADLPPASSVPFPLPFWPAAPLTSYFGSPTVGTPSVVLDGPFAAVQLGAPASSDHGAVALLKEGGGTPSFPGDFTVWAVLRGIGTAPAFYILPAVGGSGHPFLYADYTGSGVGGGGIVYSPVHLATDGGSVYCWRRTGATTEVWRNRVLLATAAGGAPSFDPALFSCYLSAPLMTLACHVFELMGWPRSQSAGEMGALWDYYQPYEDYTVIPVGMVGMFALDTPMEGWLLCDGEQYLIADHPDLAAYLAGMFNNYRVHGTTDAGHFRVPDYRGLSPRGTGAVSIDPTTSAITPAETGGEEAHVLTSGELAAHSHPVSDPGHQHGFIQAKHNFATQAYKGSTNTIIFPTVGATGLVEQAPDIAAAATGVTTTNAGGGGAHNTVHPYVGVAFFIKT